MAEEEVGRFMVHEPTGIVQCNDLTCPVGKTIEGWPHGFEMGNCLYHRTVTTSNTRQRAERAASRICKEALPTTNSGSVILDGSIVADIIAAEFEE